LLLSDFSINEIPVKIILLLLECRGKVFRSALLVKQKYALCHIGVELMPLIDVVLDRRSIRHYEQKEISKDILDKILEAGRQAPSAANKQPWHFIVLTDPEIKKKLSGGLFNRFIKDAPVTIVGCAHKDLIAGKWSIVSTTIALQNMVVAAWAMGVGSCWIGDFNEEKAKKLLNIPESWNVIALISFGYPAERPRPGKKKSLEEIVSFNKF
jgi:nitroreductase